MTDQERDALARETHQALLGIPGTDEKGLVGDVKELTERIASQNGKVRGNEVRSKVNQAVLTLLITGGGLSITKILDVW